MRITLQQMAFPARRGYGVASDTKDGAGLSCLTLQALGRIKVPCLSWCYPPISR